MGDAGDLADLMAPSRAARAPDVMLRRVAQLALAGKLPFTPMLLGRLSSRRDVERLRAEREGHAGTAASGPAE